MFQFDSQFHSHSHSLILFLCIMGLTVFPLSSFRTFALDNEASTFDDSNDQLINQYIQSKGTGIIIFDHSNIKQFWTDYSVVSRSKTFEINLGLDGFHKSNPLNIQLVNVNESQDCKVEVITNTGDLSFSVLNDQKKTISSANTKENLLGYSLITTEFHLEDTRNQSFYLQFGSDTSTCLSIKGIVLSFLNNKNSSFLSSPGSLKISNNNIMSTSKVDEFGPGAFVAVGKTTRITGKNKIFVSSNQLSSSAIVKNTGKSTTTVYFGYQIFGKDQTPLDGRNYPYKGVNHILNVISTAKENEDRIIVDSYSDWTQECYLALNAKEDLSDIPNNTFPNGRILEVKKISDNQSEITLTQPLKQKLPEGTKIRIHGRSGAYVYLAIKQIKPEEEFVFNASIKKDDNLFEYSHQTFPFGVYYAVPLILSFSADSNEESTIVVKDFTISY